MPRRRGAIIGFGFIAGNGHAPAYAASSDLEVVAVADVEPARREAATRAIPGVRVYDSGEALIAKEAAHLDFVDITTPPYAHARLAHAALDAGLHVLCEKPLATGVDEARALLAHARRAKRVILPVMNYKHAPVIKAVRNILDSGAIGAVRHVTMDTFRNTHARGVLDWNTHWRRVRRFSGGGIAMDHGSHTFYLAFEWLRAYPTAITAKMSTHGTEDTEDTFSATITFPTGTAIVNLTWAAGMRRVIYTLHGERGAIRVEDDEIELVTMGPGTNVAANVIDWRTERTSVASAWMDAGHPAWFESLLGQFSRAIDARDYVGKDAEDALRCIEVITAAYGSSERGSREVALNVPERPSQTKIRSIPADVQMTSLRAAR